MRNSSPLILAPSSRRRRFIGIAAAAWMLGELQPWAPGGDRADRVGDVRARLGRLWRTRQEVRGEPYVAVEVTNATAEPDGSYRRYFLRVSPRMRSARGAVAWSFEMGAREYSLAAET